MIQAIGYSVFILLYLLAGIVVLAWFASFDAVDNEQYWFESELSDLGPFGTFVVLLWPLALLCAMIYFLVKAIAPSFYKLCSVFYELGHGKRKDRKEQEDE